jgi:hypothetical protein
MLRKSKKMSIFLNPLKTGEKEKEQDRERETEREESGGDSENTTFRDGGNFFSSGFEGSQAVPVRPTCRGTFEEG